MVVDPPPPKAAHPQDRGAARREAFLNAAREVFLEQGYEAASVNDVVRRAGGSLATLYAQFGNKEGLFHAVMAEQYARFVQALAVKGADHLSLEEGLQALGEHFLQALLARENLAFFRIFVGEAHKLPKAVLDTRSSGWENLQGVVTEFLRRHQAVPDPQAAASYLLDLWRGRHHFRAMTNEAYAVSDEEISQHVAKVIRVVLYGVTTGA